jgi:sugar/nucleoside kinase (ribokinase family)
MVDPNLEKPAILCYGDCNIDIITPIDEIPVKGGCSFSSHLEINIGGSMLNTAVALKTLNMPVSMFSKIGRDIFGDMALDYLKDREIDTRNIIRSDYPTGVAIALVEPDGEKRWISIRKNAGDIHITYEDITAADIPDILFITGVELVEGIESRETAVEFAKTVKKSGKLVFLDPNIRVPAWELRRDVRDAFERIFPFVDILLSNEKELEILGGSEYIKIAAANVIDKGTRCIWAKLGGKGSLYITGSEDLYFEPSEDKALDTTGAGDAFNAAVIFALSKGFSPRQTGIFANLYAGYTVSRFGTTSALPTQSIVAGMIEKSANLART